MTLAAPSPVASATMGGAMVLFLALGFPIVLLALPLLMERIERPLRTETTYEEVAVVLSDGRPEEVEQLVSEGYAPAVQRYWRRHRLARLLPQRSSSDK